MKILAALTFSLALSTGVAQAATISNGPPAGNVGYIGVPAAGAVQSVGQVFTAPITGIMTSFSITLNSGIGALVGAVGNWNGTAAFATGFGSDTTLYASAATPSTTGGPYTFSPNIAVTAGSIYVAFLTTFGVPGAAGRATLPRVALDSTGINYMVWNSGASPFGDSSWNYNANLGDLLFSANFEPVPAPVPVPASLPLLATLLSGLGFAAWRRNKA